MNRILTGRWLSETAIWCVIAAWAACGAYGWLRSADGLFAIVAVALTLGCAVFATRALKNAAEVPTWGQRIALTGLGLGCLLWTAFSGHQGMAVSENERWTAYEAAEAARTDAASIDARIEALPPLPLSDEYGRPLGPVRTGVLAAARDRDIARLEAQRPHVAFVARPAGRMDERLSWMLVALVECLEVFGFFAISKRPARIGGRAANPGRDLALMRWAGA